jgi:hypothetical protein
VGLLPKRKLASVQCVCGRLTRPERRSDVPTLSPTPPNRVLARALKPNCLRLELCQQTRDEVTRAWRVPAVEPDLGKWTVVGPQLAKVCEEDLRILVLCDARLTWDPARADVSVLGGC